MKQENGIKKFRIRAGIGSQSDLARALKIKPQNVSLWEAGKGTPSFAQAKKLFEMGAMVEELFGIPYSVQSEQPANLAGLSDADAGAIVRQGLGFLYGRNV
ncbi:MAG: helix-turn-helix transcriptional regulator [Fibromonadaceae bacterium]|jgi:DNA-binding XRE family transcriptional regulator|nr:helix-turn-helix transcriptional regulator [Fibromonadaceae bacterium]